MFTALAVGLGLTASLWAQVPSYVPTNGLVGWWPFNGNANDESGNGNNGTVNGATLTTDRFGNANKAYDFDGSISNIIVENHPSLNPSAITICVWILPLSDNICIIKKSNISNASEYGYGLTHNDQFQIQRGIKSQFGSGNCSTVNDNDAYWSDYNLVQNNQWTMVTVSIDNNGLVKHFINDSLVYVFQTSPLFSCDSQTSSLRFGGEHWSNDPEWFFGKIDDIGIWNRALSECEIQNLYNSQFNSIAGSIAVSPNSALIGSNVTLSTASNSTNLQWQSNPSNYGWQNVPSNSTYNGETTNTLTVSNVQLANHNQPFRIIASLGNCTDTSNIATIQIADTCITNVTVYDTLLTTVTDTLIINTTLSLPAPNNENTILIYPNPASDHITIDNGNFAAMAGYTIKIENNAGQQVFQSAINQAQFYVDLSTWTGNGLYFVHLIDPQNNTVTVRKIVLQ
jgi:hypothetical protein